MYYDKNRRYFENKKTAFFIGLGLLATAFILFVMPATLDNYRIISILVVPTLASGCVLFFGSILRRSSETEIDEDVEKELDGFEDKVRQHFDLYDRELPYISSAVMERYHYFDTPYVRRDRQGEYRTDHYMKNVIYFTSDGLCAASRTVHLADEGTDDVFYEIPYTDVTDVKLESKEKKYIIKKKEVTVPYYEFNIYGKDGILFSCQTKRDYAVECAADDIKMLAEKSRK